MHEAGSAQFVDTDSVSRGASIVLKLIYTGSSPTSALSFWSATSAEAGGTHFALQPHQVDTDTSRSVEDPGSCLDFLHFKPAALDLNTLNPANEVPMGLELAYPPDLPNARRDCETFFNAAASETNTDVVVSTMEPTMNFQIPDAGGECEIPAGAGVPEPSHDLEVFFPELYCPIPLIEEQRANQIAAASPCHFDTFAQASTPDAISSGSPWKAVAPYNTAFLDSGSSTLDSLHPDSYSTTKRQLITRQLLVSVLDNCQGASRRNFVQGLVDDFHCEQSCLIFSANLDANTSSGSANIYVQLSRSHLCSGISAPDCNSPISVTFDDSLAGKDTLTLSEHLSLVESVYRGMNVQVYQGSYREEGWLSFDEVVLHLQRSRAGNCCETDAVSDSIPYQLQI
jgi:hypothetical protein